MTVRVETGNNKNSNRSKNIGIILLLIIPFFRPDFIAEMYSDTILNTLFTAWRIISFLYISIKSLRQVKFDVNFIIIAMYELVMLVACFYNHTNATGRLINTGNFLGIYLIYKYYADKDPVSLIKANFDFFSFLVFINCILTLIFPNGFNNAVADSGRINFLGKDNTITLLFLITIVFCVLYSNLYPKDKKPLMVVIIVFMTELYYFSGSGMVALTFLIIYMIFFWKNSIVNRILNANIIIPIYLLLNYVVVFLNRIDFLSFLFKWLNKSSTFTDRRYYWDSAIVQFLSNPRLGQGHGTTKLWGNNYYSHNALLDVLLKGGIIGLIFWCVMFFVILNKLRLDNNMRVKGFIMCVFSAFLMIGLVEGLEDRIAFNTFFAIVSILNVLEQKDILNNKLINIGIKFKVRR